MNARMYSCIYVCVYVLCENSLNRNNKHKQGNSAAFIRNTKCNYSRATGDTTKFLITRAQLSKTEAWGELILKIFIITRRSTLPASQSATHTHTQSVDFCGSRTQTQTPSSISTRTYVPGPVRGRGPVPRPEPVAGPEPSRRWLKCTHMRSDQN